MAAETINEVITITYGEVTETHAGMTKYGKKMDQGFTRQELLDAHAKLIADGAEAYLFDLAVAAGVNYEGDDAIILIVKDGVRHLGVDPDALYKQLRELEWDKHKFMYGKKVNSKARFNLCFNEEDISPNYESRATACGTTLAFHRVPDLIKIREKLPLFLGRKANNLKAEGNYYYDLDKCFISEHGDFERRIVVGLRFGGKMDISFRWYQNSKPISGKMTIWLNHGDFYVMGNKTVGSDWKKKIVPTLRHSARCLDK